jgi:ribosomal protein L3 glutamine methyltransferase
LTLGELIERTAKRFRAARLHYGHGTDNADDEAAFLVKRALRLPFDASLEMAIRAEKVEPLIRKRIDDRIPVAYLLNEAWLDGRAFYVDRRVIIPRSHIAFMLKDLGRPRSVLDLCTGSGCLAILAALQWPRAAVTGSDLSKAALTVAAKNVARHRTRVGLVQSDLFGKVPGEFDLIVTNPPYVPTASMKRLPPEYRYEPGLSLAAGSDGLNVVRRILAGAPRHLSRKGVLVCEVGEARRALKKLRLPFAWLGDSVFQLRRDQLEGLG